MTSVDITVLSTEEVCRLLGIEERRLKQLIRDRVLIEARGDDGVRGVPQEVLVKGANGWEPLPFLQGTLTLLADDGFTAEEAAGRAPDRCADVGPSSPCESNRLDAGLLRLVLLFRPAWRSRSSTVRAA